MSLTLAPAGDATKPDPERLPEQQTADIRLRIATLQGHQAEYLRKTAAGEITPDEDLRKQWPQIQEQTVALRGVIDSLNVLGADSPDRPGLETKLFGNLQQIGIHLESASHPVFTPRILDTADIAEMERIEKAISGMKLGDRKTATPFMTPFTCNPWFQ